MIMNKSDTLFLINNCIVLALLSTGCAGNKHPANTTVQQRKGGLQIVAIKELITLEKLTIQEQKNEPTRYRIDLLKPVPLEQFLRSNFVSSILSIGAKISFQLVSAEAAIEWDKKLGRTPPVIVYTSKGEFTCLDEVVFFVFFPSAAN